MCFYTSLKYNRILSATRGQGGHPHGLLPTLLISFYVSKLCITLKGKSRNYAALWSFKVRFSASQPVLSSRIQVFKHMAEIARNQLETRVDHSGVAENENSCLSHSVFFLQLYNSLYQMWWWYCIPPSRCPKWWHLLKNPLHSWMRISNLFHGCLCASANTLLEWGACNLPQSPLWVWLWYWPCQKDKAN